MIALTAIPEKDKEQQVSSESSQYSPLSFRHFILGAVGIFVYVGVEVGIPNILNKWLQNPDLDVLQLGSMGNTKATQIGRASCRERV